MAICNYFKSYAIVVSLQELEGRFYFMVNLLNNEGFIPLYDNITKCGRIASGRVSVY